MTGLAYGAQIMPVRVLDRNGEGDSVSIAKAIRWAAKHGADVLNLSFEFGGPSRTADPRTSSTRCASRRSKGVARGRRGRERGRTRSSRTPRGPAT